LTYVNAEHARRRSPPRHESERRLIRSHLNAAAAATLHRHRAGTIV